MQRDFRPGMHGRIPLSFNASRNQSALSGSITPVGNQPFGNGQTAQPGAGTSVVADRPCGHEELLWVAPAVRDGMHLVLSPPFVRQIRCPRWSSGPVFQESNPPDFLLAFQTFARRLEAQRCAFRQVALIMTTFFSLPSEANPSIIRVKPPMSPHCFQRF